MRTSRLAQDTAKLAHVLSPRRSLPHSLRSSVAPSHAETPSTTTPSRHDSASDAESALSSTAPNVSVPCSATQSTTTTPRKRKRDAETNGSATVTVSAHTRVSPRKKGGGVKLEEEEKVALDIEDSAPGVQRHPRRAKRQPAKRVVDPATGEATVHAPPDWQTMYEAVQEMRRRQLAPVDTVGCERLADVELPAKIQRFQHLVALMLSSQTKDTTTALAMDRLRTELPAPGLTVEHVCTVAPERLNELIRVVGFHNNKTRYLKATAEILRDEYDGDVPDSAEALMRLPGVGPKMAHLCMSAAWGKTEGIGVDVHVHRITNRFGWHPKEPRNPEETRMWLESWLPREKWHEINGLLVGFGQTVCAPVGPRCGECVLSERGLCPSAVVERRKKVKRVKKEVVEQEPLSNGDVVVKDEVTEEVSLKQEEKTIEDLQY